MPFPADASGRGVLGIFNDPVHSQAESFQCFGREPAAALPGPRVLVAADQLPLGRWYGSATYLFDLLQFLVEHGCEVEHVLLPPPKRAFFRIPNHVSQWIRVSTFGGIRFGRFLVYPRAAFSDILHRLLGPMMAVCRGTTDAKGSGPTARPIRDFLTPAMAAFARERIRRFKPDVVVANYLWLADVFDGLPAEWRGLRVIMTYDVMHARRDSFVAAGLPPEPHCDWTADEEAEQLRKAQVLVAIQRAEAQEFSRLVPQCEVLVAPMAARLNCSDQPTSPGRCLFVGGSSAHNTWGLQWLLEKVWPQVIRQLPESRLHICGEVCRTVRRPPPSVRLLGLVEDLSTQYAECEVVLVPILAGSGLKIKLVEGLAHGKACVATSVGVQGCEDLSGRAAFVTDDPSGFAEGICRVLTDASQRRQMEEAARQYVVDYLSPEAAYGPLLARIRCQAAKRAEGG